MRVLVTGGTGTVGSEVVERLRQQEGVDTRLLTTSAVKAMNTAVGVEGVVGDLLDPGSLGPAFDGVDRLFLLTPLHPDEAAMGRNAVAAARAAGVERVVFLSVHRVEEAGHVPHFRTKIEIQDSLEESRIPHTLLMSNHFYQNDAWVIQAMREHGVYPQPIGERGLSRVDVRDIADAAVACLLEDGHLGERVPVVGPDVWTGPGTAEVWSGVLGREVAYGGSDVEAWGEQARHSMPDWLVEDLKVMFAWFVEHGLRASEDDYAAQRKVLGKEPRSFEAYVREVAAAT